MGDFVRSVVNPQTVKVVLLPPNLKTTLEALLENQSLTEYRSTDDLTPPAKRQCSLDLDT